VTLPLLQKGDARFERLFATKGVTMSKRLMLLAFAAASAAMFALPAAASAAWDIDPAGVSFSGTTTQTSTLTATGEPTLSCIGKSHLSGSYNGSSQTTGSITIDFTECHINPFGITIACTTGEFGNTIVIGGTFHNVINGTKTEIQWTTNSLTVKCGGTTPLVVTGTVNGNITQPACSTWSNAGEIQFVNAGGLFVETEGSGNKVAANFLLGAILKFAQSVTKTC